VIILLACSFMSIQTPGETTAPPIETQLTDRQLLVHLLEHAEATTEQLAELRAMVEPFRAVLAAAAPGGRADAISLAQAGRLLRSRGGRRGN
jgi:hypothetical protein